MSEQEKLDYDSMVDLNCHQYYEYFLENDPSPVFDEQKARYFSSLTARFRWVYVANTPTLITLQPTDELYTYGVDYPGEPHDIFIISDKETWNARDISSIDILKRIVQFELLEELDFALLCSEDSDNPEVIENTLDKLADSFLYIFDEARESGFTEYTTILICKALKRKKNPNYKEGSFIYANPQQMLFLTKLHYPIHSLFHSPLSRHFPKCSFSPYNHINYSKHNNNSTSRNSSKKSNSYYKQLTWNNKLYDKLPSWTISNENHNKYEINKKCDIKDNINMLDIQSFSCDNSQINFDNQTERIVETESQPNNAFYVSDKIKLSRKDNTNKDNTNKDNLMKDNIMKDNMMKDNVMKDNMMKDNLMKDNNSLSNTEIINDINDIHLKHIDNEEQSKLSIIAQPINEEEKNHEPQTITLNNNNNINNNDSINSLENKNKNNSQIVKTAIQSNIKKNNTIDIPIEKSSIDEKESIYKDTIVNHNGSSLHINNNNINEKDRNTTLIPSSSSSSSSSKDVLTEISIKQTKIDPRNATINKNSINSNNKNNLLKESHKSSHPDFMKINIFMKNGIQKQGLGPRPTINTISKYTYDNKNNNINNKKNICLSSSVSPYIQRLERLLSQKQMLKPSKLEAERVYFQDYIRRIDETDQKKHDANTCIEGKNENKEKIIEKDNKEKIIMNDNNINKSIHYTNQNTSKNTPIDINDYFIDDDEEWNPKFEPLNYLADYFNNKST
ncbi:hypothetical protein WA158_001854 [Blastocystis sp. Blastoise]